MFHPGFLKKTELRASILALFLMAVFCIENPYEYRKPENVTVVINEFLTSNSLGIILDDAGEPEDFIELYNYGSKGINLDGLYLSDDSTDLFRYKLPDTTIPVGGYLVIWADNDPDQGKLHAPFKLSGSEGEEIILSLLNGVKIDRIQFFPHSGNPEARLPDISYGRVSDGAEEWGRQAEPTPGYKNKSHQVTAISMQE